MKRYIIKQEPEPLYKTGQKYVLYYEGDAPRYMAAETKEALLQRLHQCEPDAIIVLGGSIVE